MLSAQEVRQFSQLSPTRTWISLLGDWGLIAGLFASAIIIPHPVIYMVVFVLMGRQQLALAILMHDGAHGRLFSSLYLNRWVGQFLTAGPLFFSMESYRNLHLKHHRDPLIAEDPDIGLIGGYPISGRSLIRKLLRDLSGISYFKFIGYFIYRAPKKNIKATSSETSLQKTSNKTRRRQTVFFLVTSVFIPNGILFIALFFLGHPWLYLFFWILPMMTILQFLLRIRGIAEHAGYQPNENQMLNSRTVINPLQTFLFAPHKVNYHMEHHQYPSIPWYRLPKVHRIMADRNSLPPTNLFHSYRDIINSLVR